MRHTFQRLRLEEFSSGDFGLSFRRPEISAWAWPGSVEFSAGDIGDFGPPADEKLLRPESPDENSSGRSLWKVFLGSRFRRFRPGAVFSNRPNVEYRVWKIEYRVLKLLYRVWKLEYRVWKLDYRVWKLEYRVWKLEYRVWKLEYRVWKLEYRVLKLEYRVWKLEYRIWKLEYRVWKLEYRVWKLEYRVWKLEYRDLKSKNWESPKNCGPAPL